MLTRKFFTGLTLGLSLFTCADFTQAQELDMHEVKLGVPAQLKFALMPESRCSFGDLDVIALDTNNPDTVLQLSVEEFGGTNAVYYGKPEMVENAKHNYTVTIPPYKRPAILGVYLCSVKKGSKDTPCGRFPARSYNELVAPYTVDITRAQINASGKLGAAPLKNPGKAETTGKIYFFKFLVVDGSGNVMFPKGRMTDAGYSQLLKQIAAKKGKINNGEWQTTKLKMLGATLGSEPLGLNENIITMTLPFYDKKKCKK